jgi:hypothetical protein
LEDRLSDDQKEKLRLTTSMDERIAMLKSWGFQVPARREHRGNRRFDPSFIPPSLEAKLSDEQKLQFLDAKTLDERLQLIREWNIDMPARRHGADSHD